MGSVIRLIGLPAQISALGKEADAHRELADIALTQANAETDEADLQAGSIRAQAQMEAGAISMQTSAGVESELYNARQAALNADLVTADANLNEIRQRRANRRATSSQIATIASTGFEVSDFDDVIRTSAEEASMDALLIRRDGRLANLDFMAKAALSRERAKDIQAAGDIARRNVVDVGEMNARTALFTGRTRSRASRAEAIRARAGASGAEAKKSVAVIDAFASVADDAAKAVSTGAGVPSFGGTGKKSPVRTDAAGRVLGGI